MSALRKESREADRKDFSVYEINLCSVRGSSEKGQLGLKTLRKTWIMMCAKS